MNTFPIKVRSIILIIVVAGFQQTFGQPTPPPVVPINAADAPARIYRNGEALAPERSASTPEGPARIYPVTKISFRYGGDPAGLPAPALISANLQLTFGVKDGIFVPVDGKLTQVSFTPDQLPANAKFNNEAYAALLQQTVDYFTARDLMAVFVLSNPNQINPQTGEASAAYLNNPNLELVIWVNRVAQMRTISKGGRFDLDHSINNPANANILYYSPILAADSNAPQQDQARDNRDLLKKNELEDYLRRLNRYSGRRVDAALSSGSQAGKVNLDYLVTETKPWLAYSQLSNTGSSSTGLWNERFGYMNSQVTNFDDIFTADYVTSNFANTSNLAEVSYERPLKYPDYIRAKVYGSYSNFNAQNIGLANVNFTGQTWTAGTELIFSPFSVDGFSVDFPVGMRWENTRVDNPTLSQSQMADFYIPYTGIRVDRQQFTNSTHGDITFEGNVNHLSQGAANQLGRLDTQPQSLLMKWNGTESFYLEPLLFGQSFYDGQNWQASTLAQEVLLRFSGQYAFGDHRVVPQTEGVAGGYYTVRGYPTSFLAGDTAMSATLEYALHLPRLLKPYATPDNPKGEIPAGFKWRAPGVYALPDWDFIVRGFLDVGQVYSNQAKTNEVPSFTLASAGGGIELKASTHLSVRLDVGVVLKGINNPAANIQVGAGHTQATLIATFTY